MRFCRTSDPTSVNGGGDLIDMDSQFVQADV